MNIEEYATEIVEQMNTDDRRAILAAGDAEAWRDGLSMWPDITADMLDDLLQAIAEAVKSSQRDTTTTLIDIHDELEPYGDGLADWDWAVRVVFARAGERGAHRVIDSQWSIGNGENTINLVLPTAAVWLALVDLGYARPDPRSPRPYPRWPRSRVYAGPTLRKLCSAGETRREVTRAVWSEMQRRRDDE